MKERQGNEEATPSGYEHYFNFCYEKNKLSFVSSGNRLVVTRHLKNSRAQLLDHREHAVLLNRMGVSEGIKIMNS